jgi:hypothetical protein
MFAKAAFDADPFIQANLTGSKAITLDSIMQAAKVSELCNDKQVIKEALEESKVREYC